MASDDNRNYKVHAIVAPAIAGQFTYAKPGQIFSAIKEIGFYSIEEAALGADIVAYHEAEELKDREDVYKRQRRYICMHQERICRPLYIRRHRWKVLS